MRLVPTLRRPHRPRRPAAATVEFAMVSPLLMTLLLACIDLGRFAHHHIAVTNAARAGAGRASAAAYDPEIHDLFAEDVREAVTEDLERLPHFDPDRLSVTVTEEPDTGDHAGLRVEVRYPFTTLIGWPGLPSSLTLKRAVVMRTARE